MTHQVATTVPPEGHQKGLELEAISLSRSVGGKVIVDHVSLHVAAGEVLAVLGPSGGGKSSLLRMLNRLDEPTGGSVLLGGQDYRSICPQQLRRRVGMVMQTAFLFPGTVADNVAFGPRQRGDEFPVEQIYALLERVGLPGYAQRDASTLSGGEAQRISIARTLANNPQVLLLDEPTSALDETTAGEVEQLILTLNRERGLTCIIVTHNREQAIRVAPRMIVIKSGKVVESGATTEALSA